MNKNKALKIAATSLACAVLGGALFYFNFVDNAAEPSLKVGDEAPGFTLQTYYVEDDTLKTGGEEVSLEKQDKITIINFWATWCAPCIAEMPYFSRLQENYAEFVDVFVITDEISKNGHNGVAGAYEGLCAWINEQKVDNSKGDTGYEYWTDYSFTFGFYDKKENNVYENYGFKGAMPSTAIIDADGVVRVLHEGKISYEQLEAEFLEVLGDVATENPAPEGPIEPTAEKKNWWKENALGVTFLAVSAATLATVITVSAVGTAKQKKKKK